MAVFLGLFALDFGLKELRHGGLIATFRGSFVEFGTALRDTKATFADDGVWVTPTAITIALVFLTCAGVLAGIELALGGPGRWKYPIALMLFTFTFAFITSAGTGVRGHLIVTALLCFGSYLATKIYVVGTSFRFALAATAGGFAALAAFLVWVVVVQSARRGDFEFDNVPETLDYLRPWFAGYLPALSQWSSGAEFQISHDQAAFPGSYLFSGILSSLGVQQGEGFSSLIRPVSIGEGATTNAMTIFRVLILDFGYAGTLAVCAAAGYFFQRLYTRVIDGSLLAVIPLGAVYSAIIYSFNYWFFARGSRVAGVILALAILVLATRSRSVAKRPLSSAPDGVTDAKI